MILKKLGIEGNFLNMVKGINEKPTANFLLTDERWKAVPHDQEWSKDVFCHHFYSMLYWKF